MDARTPRFGTPRLWAALTTAILIAGVAVGAVAWLRRPPAEPLEVYGQVPEFSLVERSGEPVTRARLVGRVSVVEFFYTRCEDSCPLQNAHLARLQAEHKDVADLQLVSITVDPDHDTPPVLREYAARFGADPRRWLFLTGQRDAIYRLAVDGFHLAVIARGSEASPALWAWIAPRPAWAHGGEGGPRIIRLAHGSRFALVGRRARIRGYFDGLDWNDVARLGTQIERLLAER